MMVYVSKKAFFVFTVCSCLVLPAVYAQGERPSGQMGGRPPSAEDMVERMQDDLDLTDEQTEKIKEIFEEQRNEMDARMNSGSTKPDREQMESLRTRMEEKMAQVLTPEQLEKWKNSRPQGGPGKGGGPQ